jgi:hypothetical protein
VALVMTASAWLAVLSVPGAQAATVCNEAQGQEVNSNVAGNLSVPANGVCHINGWHISGSVTVGNNAKLFTRNGTNIDGSIVATSPQQLNIEKQTVIGASVSVTGPGGGFGGFACGAVIHGGVVLRNLTSGTWVIGQPVIEPPDGYVYNGGGSNDPDLTCKEGNVIGTSVLFSNNNVGRLKLASNGISGSVSITNNTVFFESIKVETNNIGGSLVCSGNAIAAGAPPAGQPPVTNEGLFNNVSGSETGQCAGL